MDHTLFLSCPGFLYQIGKDYFYLGKWICQKCTDCDVTDTHFMYKLALQTPDSPELNLYFQKLRAYSDFALVPPLNTKAVQEAQNQLLSSLDEKELEDLLRQRDDFISCHSRFIGGLS